MAVIWWIILTVVILVVLWVIFVFNRLITLKNRVENSWSQIQVQLKKRTDLLPNLIETVKGYMRHERSLLQNITKARSAIITAQKKEDVRGMAKADNILTGALKSLFAVAENYPRLRANENFKLLQEQLEGIENKIAYARQFYNDSIMTYEVTRERFPANLIARGLGFKEREYFEIPERETRPIKVKF